MKYYFLETDERNKIPYAINKNHAFDIRHVTKEGLAQFPRWNMTEMIFPQEGFFPDILCRPCLFLSETCIDVLIMYEVDASYRGIKLWDREKGISVTYFLTAMEEVDCISEETTYNRTGNRIEQLVLDKERIGNRVAFRVKGYKRNGFIARLDYVESILRREARGIRFEQICVR